MEEATPEMEVAEQSQETEQTEDVTQQETEQEQADGDQDKVDEGKEDNTQPGNDVGNQDNAADQQEKVDGDQEQPAEQEQADDGDQEQPAEQEQADDGDQEQAAEQEQADDGDQEGDNEQEQPTEKGEQLAEEEGGVQATEETRAAGEPEGEPEGEPVGEPDAEPDNEQVAVGEDDPANDNNNAGGQQDEDETQDPPAEDQQEETPEEAQQEQDTARSGEQDEQQDKEDKAQETTPKPTSAQSVEIPTQPIADGDEEGEQDALSPRMEDMRSPEPDKEHTDMGTGMEQAAYGEPEVQSPIVQHAAPSPIPQFDQDATATVKFVLLPTQQVATLRCYLTQTLYELKEHFAQELKITANSILFMLDGKGTADRMTLGELGVGPNGTIRLEMQSADPDNQPIKAFKPRQEYTMPDVISVRVASAAGGIKDVVVEIERSNKRKAFLGGYRHKKTNVEYHHASAQTAQKPRPPPSVERFCRDTQTMQQKHMLQQTTNDMSTQMTKIGVYVSNMKDMLKIPGKYTTADDFRMNQLHKVIVIQKYYRRWLAKRYVEKVRSDQERRIEWEREEELRKKKEKEDRIRREFERRMNPKTKEDFDLLFHALEKWRQEEMNNIDETLSGAERKAALCQLLDQETQLIASIGRHKLEANDEQKQKQIQSFLEKAASPKKWKAPDGKQTEMDTPYTIRAQELKDIYNSINMKYLTQDERLDVLLTLKHTVKEHDCKLTQEIIELIDREADLLMRGVKESNLEGLRRRISTLYLQYIKTPTFNPEAARLLKVPQDPTTLRKNIYFCPSCSMYLPSTEFGLSSNSRAVGKCRKCNKTDNDARVRQDYSHYRYMLKSIRRSEDAYQDGSKIAFLMQENDLRYLVENVWNSQSVLSAWEDLYDLVLVRWDRHQEWAPWNSILLTKEEATAHDKLEQLEEAYGKVFVHKVKHKHTLARNYFSRMPGMAEHMRSNNNSARPNGPAVSGKAIVTV